MTERTPLSVGSTRSRRWRVTLLTQLTDWDQRLFILMLSVTDDSWASKVTDTDVFDGGLQHWRSVWGSHHLLTGRQNSVVWENTRGLSDQRFLTVKPKGSSKWDNSKHQGLYVCYKNTHLELWYDNMYAVLQHTLLKK